MALRDWLSNSGGVATATLATLATHDQDNRPTVATVANVAVAKEKKREILPALPIWCRSDCPGLESFPLANEGEVAGCVHPVTGSWRRLDWLAACPAMEKKITCSALPEWCNSNCEYHLRLELPAVGTFIWCFREGDKQHWRVDKIITMNGCPKAGA